MAQSGLMKAAAALKAFDYDGEARRIIMANQSALVDLLKDQLAEGKDADNNAIRLDGNMRYHLYTIQYKKRHGIGLGAVTSPITLYMSGNLYSRLFTNVEDNRFSIKSDVPYFDDILVRTGDRVTGLNEESRKKFVFEILLPAFQKVFETKTGIKLTSK